MITITTLKQATKGELKDVIHLITELRRNPAEHKGSLADLRDIVADKKATMVVAKDGAHIIGMATLYVIVKVGKRFGCVEDVVVDSRYRGQGLGKKLMSALIAAGRKKKLAYLFLTSHAGRGAANNLYPKLGFELVDTNPYKLKF
jgi:ribosomal protein S18 acetylase RimI-like enzyme